MPFQRFAPSLPPTQNDNSADIAEPTVCHFSGFIAKYAKFATTIAIFATEGSPLGQYLQHLRRR
jgi:hypothetical protein